MTTLRQKMTQLRKSVQKGFTLIELAIVGLFLGLLALFAISQFSSSATDTTRANALIEASQKIADNWALVAQTCGANTDITSLNLTTNAGTNAAVGNLDLLLGAASPHSSFAACFNQSGVRPLSGMAQGSGASTSINGYITTLGAATVNGRQAVTVAFAGVPDNVTLSLFNKLSSATGAATATAVPATADTTDPAVRFSAATAGKRTVTLVRVL